MKHLTFLLLFILSTGQLNPLAAQQDSISNDTLKAFLDERYTGGYDAFVYEVEDRLDFPVTARKQGIFGVLKTKLVIAADGKIEHVTFDNELGYGFEEDVHAVLMKTEPNWRPAKTQDSCSLKIGFYFGELDMPRQGDLNIVIYNANPYVKPDVFHENQLAKLMRKKKYEKAVVHCKEMLRRYPDETTYQKYMQAIRANEKF